jgi:hypothetical protein
MKEVIARTCKWIGLPGLLIIVCCLAASWLVIGCSTARQSSEVSAGTTGKSGAQLWAENCVRCHNIRSPSNYSPAQWEVVMLHMRVRANLTPDEHKKILAFLKSGS